MSKTEKNRIEIDPKDKRIAELEMLNESLKKCLRLQQENLVKLEQTLIHSRQKFSPTHEKNKFPA